MCPDPDEHLSLVPVVNAGAVIFIVMAYEGDSSSARGGRTSHSRKLPLKEITSNVTEELEALPPHQCIDKGIHPAAGMGYAAIFRRYVSHLGGFQRPDKFSRA